MTRITLFLALTLSLFTGTGCQVLQGLAQGVAQGAQQNQGVVNAGAPGADLAAAQAQDTLAQAGTGTQGEDTPILGGADQNTGKGPTAADVLAGGTGTRGGGDGLYISADQVEAMGPRIDAFMAQAYPASTMQGQGNLIAACSARYGVPVDLAMGMLGLEAGFAKRGTRAATNNNPGNIKDGSGKYGPINGTDSKGHARYTSMEAGVEAYFKLLSNPDSFYWKHIRSGDYRRIYAIYAPASDGNNVSQYERDVNSIRNRFRAALGSSSIA